MKSHQHIVIICSRLDLPGGIEKANIGLANLFEKHHHTVSLLIADEYKEPFYPVSSSVTQLQRPLTFGVGMQKGILRNKLQFLRDTYQLKDLLKQSGATIVISTEYTYTVAMTLAANKKTMQLISWEHHHYSGLAKSKFWKSMLKFSYKKLNTIVCLNPAEEALYKKAGYPTTTIPHFLPFAPSNDAKKRKNEILTIGWLSAAKGIDLLLIVAKRILNNYPGWTWRIIGKGDMQNRVETFIKLNSLQDRLIITPPDLPDLSHYYNDASLLVHCSRNEAFGLVIAEAMSYGIPAVAFNCPTGPAHIIKHKEDGILVANGDTEGMTSAVSNLIDDTALRLSMGAKAIQNIKRFSAEVVYKQWEKLLKL